MPLGHFRNQLSNPYNNYPPNFQHHQQGPSQSFHSQLHNPAPHLGGGPGGGFGNQSTQTSHANLFGGGASLTNGAANAFTNGVGVGGAFNNGGVSAAFTNGAGLGSQEAQMGFARGAALQQSQSAIQNHGQDLRTGMSTAQAAGRGSQRIRDVWKSNLSQEMEMIRHLLEKYPYISMDTEFPGVVARPMGNFPNKADYHYQTLRVNVDILNLIQLGITLFSSEGEIPPAQVDQPLAKGAYPNSLLRCPCTWCFHFKFSLEEDMYADASISLLQSAGVDFTRNERDGIDPQEFASLLITSGLVLNRDTAWISFHSGYDFGYLLKIMIQTNLPAHEEEYLAYVRKWFPRVYDVKFLLRKAQEKGRKGILGQQATNHLNNLGTRSALADLAAELGVVREGHAHTAGSDAWLTGQVFWQMRSRIFDNQISDEYIGSIWGLSEVPPPASAATQAAAIQAGQQTPNINGATLSYHTEMTPGAFNARNKASNTESPSTPQTSASAISTTPGAHGGYGGHHQGMAGLAGAGTGGYGGGYGYGR